MLPKSIINMSSIRYIAKLVVFNFTGFTPRFSFKIIVKNWSLSYNILFCDQTHMFGLKKKILKIIAIFLFLRNTHIKGVCKCYCFFNPTVTPAKRKLILILKCTKSIVLKIVYSK